MHHRSLPPDRSVLSLDLEPGADELSRLRARVAQLEQERDCYLEQVLALARERSKETPHEPP